MGAHSKFAPSSLFRTRICPGWIKEAEGIEEQETEEALEGEASHFIGEMILKNRSVGSELTRDVFIGQTAPNGTLMNDDMYDCAEFYADYVSKFVMDWSKVHIECQMDIKAVHEECFGTPDLFMHYDNNSNMLHVMDYKYGHRRVQAYANEQLMAYAIGACEQIGVVPETIVLHVIQPRCFDGFGQVSSWSLTYGRLMDEIEEISNACVIASSDDPYLMTSVEGCRDCPARYRCSALGTEVARMPVSTEQNERSPAMIAYELKVLKDYIVKATARAVGLEEEVKSGLAKGVNYPGWSMQQRFGHNKWKAENAEIIAMGSLFGCDFTEVSVVSPAQANKLLKQKNIDASVISNYYEKAQSGMALVASDSIKANMIFGE